MHSIHRISLFLSLAACACTPALADNVPGTGAGYYGEAEYDSGQGSVVGPYATWNECNQALQNAIDNAVNNFGWSVVSIDGCGYSSGLLNHGHDIHVELAALSPADSGAIAHAVLDEQRRVRTLYRADEYEARLRMIEKAVRGK